MSHVRYLFPGSDKTLNPLISLRKSEPPTRFELVTYGLRNRGDSEQNQNLTPSLSQLYANLTAQVQDILGQIAVGDPVSVSAIDDLAWSILRNPELASEAREATMPAALAVVQAEPGHKPRQLVNLAKLLLDRSFALSTADVGDDSDTGTATATD